MASWKDVTDSAPEFAQLAKKLFDVHKHKTLATVRRDGSPRISGTEISFSDGDVWWGGMWMSRKCLDLRADPRFALHGPTVDPDANWKGDVKLSGRAVEIEDPASKAAIQQASGGEAPPGPFHLFRADIREVVITQVGDPPDHLVIQLWREGEKLKRFERR